MRRNCAAPRRARWPAAGVSEVHTAARLGYTQSAEAYERAEHHPALRGRERVAFPYQTRAFCCAPLAAD